VIIGILSRKRDLKSTQLLVRAASDRGHHVEVIDPIRCFMNIASMRPMIQFREKRLDHFHAVIPRIGASITFYGAAVVRQFEMMNTYTVNGSLGVSRARDTLRVLQMLSRKGVGLPTSSFAHSTKMTKELIELVGGAPLVIKLLSAPQGGSVVFAQTAKAAESVIDAFRRMDAYFIVQEYIPEAEGADIRCVVVGGKVVASLRRQAGERGLSTSLKQTDLISSVEITREENETALRAAKVVGLGVAGVDFLRSKRGALVIGVTPSPSFVGIDRICGVNVADKVIQYVEKKVKSNSN
jgi:ribosomal protein S6--L-glutamate ligase